MDITSIVKNFYYYRIVDNLRWLKKTINEKCRSKTADFDDVYQLYFGAQDKLNILDVGAFDGRSVKRFRKLFSNAHLHCFEPSNNNYELLSKAYGNDNNTSLNKAAVDDNDATAILSVNEKPDTSSLLKVDVSDPWVKRRSQEFSVKPEDFTTNIEEVKTIKLDTYVERENLNEVEILKIDTQGFETMVIKGGEKSLKDRKFVFVEVEIILQGLYEGVEKNIYDIEQYLIPNGYKLIATSSKLNALANKSMGFDAVYARADAYDKVISLSGA